MRLVLLAAVTAITLAGCAPAAPLTEAQRSDAVIARHLDADEPGCSAAVGRSGEVVWAGALGLADVAQSTPLTTESVLDMASVAKQFTAVAVLLLEEDGVLALDDTLADWVDGLPADAELISIADLVHHTSGIADYTSLMDAELADSTTQQDAIDTIAALSRLRGGGGFSYSNSNYVLLAEVVQNASGQPLAEFLDERVFTPLELDMRLEPLYDGPGVALGYEAGEVVESGWTQIGDGSLYTTPSGLVRWGDNYRTGVVGGPALLEAQLAGAVDTGRGGYGAGIEIAPDGALSHLGGWAGFVTFFGVTPDRSTSIAVMCNSVDASGGAIAESLLNIWG